jgi:apolipoprotein N-acyltransferase
MPAYESSPKVSFAIIQLPYNVSINELPFGSYDGHTFSNFALEALIREASKQAEVVIYPFSPVQGSVYINADATATPTQDDVPHEVLGMWLADVALSSAVLFWVAAVDGHNLYDQYLLWQRGRMSEYQKQALYPLSDYEPGWSRLFGLPARHKEVAAGQGGEFGFGKGAASGLICSELHQGALARARAKEVALIVAVGSDAMFPGELAGTFSLAAARLRAAEHSTSLLRGNINGPSALVNPDGSLVAKLEYREEGILYGALPAEEFSETPFARTGPSPLYVSVVVVVGVAWYLRWRS